MINWTAIFDTLATFPLRGVNGRYMNGLLHGGAAIAVTWLAAVAVF